jgi:hypothetical protein
MNCRTGSDRPTAPRRACARARTDAPVATTVIATGTIANSYPAGRDSALEKSTSFWIILQNFF